MSVLESLKQDRSPRIPVWAWVSSALLACVTVWMVRETQWDVASKWYAPWREAWPALFPAVAAWFLTAWLWHIQRRRAESSSHLGLSLLTSALGEAYSSSFLGFMSADRIRDVSHHQWSGLGPYPGSRSGTVVPFWGRLGVILLHGAVVLLVLNAVTHDGLSWGQRVVLSLVLGTIRGVMGPGVSWGVQSAVGAGFLMLWDAPYPCSHAWVIGLWLWLPDLVCGGVVLVGLADFLEKRKSLGYRDDLKTIGVVIPTWQEEREIEETVRRLKQIPEVVQLVVVDGGSTDRTVERARGAGCMVLEGRGGRGGQMRLGAQQVTADVVLLVHADTWLEPGAGQAILRALRDRQVSCGGLWKAFREPPWLLRGSRLKCALRVLVGRRLVGDMAMFLPRATLEQLGGVPEMELMEDLALAAAARKVGILALADSTVSTSARRFREQGVLKTYARMWRVSKAYKAGTSPAELKRMYESTS